MSGKKRDVKGLTHRLSMILPAVSGVLLLLFLVFLLITESVQITRVRGREDFIHVDDVEFQEV